MLLIAPYQGFADRFVEIFEEHNRLNARGVYDTDQYRLEVVVASCPSEIRDLNLDVEVVISRGFVSEGLRRMEYFVPLVEIPVAAGDLVLCLHKAKTDFNCRQVAVLGAHNMVMGADKLGAAVGLKVHQFVLDSTDEIHAAVEKAVSTGLDVIIGGVVTCRYAEEMGSRHVLLESGKETIWHSIAEAKRLAYVSRRAEEKTENLKAILNQSLEGIIALDNNERIAVFNQGASKILSIAPGNALGKSIAQILPSLHCTPPAGGEDGLAPEIIRHNEKNLSVSCTTMSLRGESIGRVFTLQEVSRIQELETRIREKIYIRGHIAKHTFEDIIGDSRRIHEVLRTAKKYSGVDSSILITGKTGTGKELFAQSIHNYSPRKGGPFVAVNCAALSESLLESELFGYADGAFTGASKGGKPGLFELAHRGTLFLDEISEIPPRLQGRLLRAIQEKEIMRVGHDRVIPVDARIITATNKDLTEMVNSGAFREDLYYRLDILKLELPDLSERREDIPAIAEYWVQKYSRQFKMQDIGITEKAKKFLMNADWPGNIRQLRNICERLVVLSQCNIIDVRDVEIVMRGIPPQGDIRETDRSRPIPVSRDVFQEEARDYERERLVGALKQSGYNKLKAAHLLGVSRTTLWRRMKDLQLV
jgi:transcriptional regulator with PAS, ATPase and Fis domain